MCSPTSPCNTAQPTISSALKRLEETTEKRLLDRRPGHFALTPAGETLYRESCMLFGSISRLPGLMAAAETVVTGHVAIAMTSHVVCPHSMRQWHASTQPIPR